MRHCKACNAELKRRGDENLCDFRRRMNCDAQCAIRARAGERSGTARLTEAQVRGVKSDLEYGVHAKTIAQALGVSEGAIRGIQYGLTWRHVV